MPPPRWILPPALVLAAIATGCSPPWGSPEPAAAGDEAGAAAEPGPRPPAELRWRRSAAVGLPHAGRPEAGVALPAEGRHFATWDPVLRRSPNRGWRR